MSYKIVTFHHKRPRGSIRRMRVATLDEARAVVCQLSPPRTALDWIEIRDAADELVEHWDAVGLQWRLAGFILARALPSLAT